MDDTWVIQKQAHKQEFLEHLNKVDPATKITVAENKGNGAIPFLDTLVTPLADNSLSFKVYQKPTHTDHYLQWDSHHSLSSMYSVIGTLTHRAKVVCTDPESPQGELKHLRSVLGKCNYPTWAIKRYNKTFFITTGRILAPAIQTTATTQAQTTMATTSTTKATIQPSMHQETKLP